MGEWQNSGKRGSGLKKRTKEKLRKQIRKTGHPVGDYGRLVIDNNGLDASGV